jgi:geranylgeranyl pyrophosphate synthase
LCIFLPQHQDAGFTFGKNLALLRQLVKDYQEINTELKTIPLINAVVIQNKHILPPNVLEKPLNTQIPVPERTRLKLQNSETAQKIEDLTNSYGNNALESLECFPNSEAKTCLENLVKHLVVGENK